MSKNARISFAFILLVLFNLPVSTVVAQDRVEEAEVQLQKRFIEANREKILGAYDKAIAIYEEIQKKDRKNDAVAYELARLYDMTSDNDKAIRSIRSAIELAPQNLWYQKFLADLYEKTGRFKDAAALYASMSKIAPGDEQLYYRQAFLLVKDNDLNGALKVYDDLERQTSVSEELIRRKHALYLGLGNTKKARQELERLVAAFPHEIEYRHLLAEFLVKNGEQSDARKVYQDILQLDPDDGKAKLALAGGKTAARSTDGGLTAQMRPVFEDPQVDIDLKIGRIMPFIQEVANSRARQMADDLLTLTGILERVHPNEAKAFSASGDLLYFSGRPAEALKKYERTLELDDTVYLVWEQVMYIHSEAGDYKKLRSVAEEVMDLFPNKARASYFNAVAAHQTGDAEEAVDLLEQALLMAGQNGPLVFDIQLQLGLSYTELEQFNSARQAFEAALQMNPKAPMALNNYSYMLARSGEQLDKAADLIRQADQLAPNHPVIQDTYGWVFYKMQDYKKAREWTAKALANGGDQNPVVLEHYGDILFQAGEKDQAVTYWQKALELGASSKLLQKKIADRQLYE